MKTLTYKIAKSMRSVIGSLIILTALCSVSKGEISGKEFLQNNNELAFQLKSWMSNNSFWSNDSESTDPDLALQMKSWISNGTFWSEEMVNEEPDLALQIKSWIKNGTFWKESNDQSDFLTELASN